MLQQQLMMQRHQQMMQQQAPMMMAKDGGIVQRFNGSDKMGERSQNLFSALSESELEDERKSLVQTIGENIQLRRISTVEFSKDMSIGLYLHSDSKLASIVSVTGGNEVVAKDIAMHVSAFNPLCLSEDDIDKDVLDRERAIYENQANESGKPKEIMAKMIDGKIKRFLSEVSLLSQNFVKDPDLTVSDYLSQHDSNIVTFSRLKVGEGIEVDVKDFAEEVAEQLK